LATFLAGLPKQKEALNVERLFLLFNA